MKVDTIRIDARKLKKARGNRLMRDVAKAICVSRQTLWQVENGHSVPSAEIMARLCVLYGIGVEDVISKGTQRESPRLKSELRKNGKL